jgi:hypothetical protein
VQEGENLGYIETDTLKVNHGSFLNKGTAVLESLQGTRIFKNQATLRLSGTEAKRSLLGIRSFLNALGAEAVPLVKGGYVTVSKATHRFILEAGQVKINDLLIEAGGPSAVYRTHADLFVNTLTVNHPDFENWGAMWIGARFSGAGTLLNKKTLTVQGVTELRQGQLLNDGTAELHGQAEIGTVTNKATLIVKDGLTVDQFTMPGEPQLKRLFPCISSLRTPGRLISKAPTFTSLINTYATTGR